MGAMRTERQRVVGLDRTVGLSTVTTGLLLVAGVGLADGWWWVGALAAVGAFGLSAAADRRRLGRWLLVAGGVLAMAFVVWVWWARAVPFEVVPLLLVGLGVGVAANRFAFGVLWASRPRGFGGSAPGRTAGWTEKPVGRSALPGAIETTRPPTIPADVIVFADVEAGEEVTGRLERSRTERVLLNEAFSTPTDSPVIYDDPVEASDEVVMTVTVDEATTAEHTRDVPAGENETDGAGVQVSIDADGIEFLETVA